MWKQLKSRNIYELISDWYRKIDIKYKSCMLGTISLGIFTHLKIMIFFMGNYDFICVGVHMDSDMIRSGRWLLQYASSMSGVVNVHMLIGLLSIIFIGLTACMIIDIFQIKHNFNSFLVGAIMVTFPTVTSTFLYMYTADAYMISLFFATSSVWIVLKGKKYIPISIVLLTCSLGIYQAYISVAMTLIVVMAIIELIHTDNIKEYIKKYANYIFVGITSVGLYYIILQWRLSTLGYELTSYQGMSSVSLERMPQYIKAAYVDFLGGGDCPKTSVNFISYNKV